MANVISVTVYNFEGVGNAKVGMDLMGLPAHGAFVTPVQLGKGPDPHTYVYSKITYPFNGLPGKEYYTAETVAAIISKFNA